MRPVLASLVLLAVPFAGCTGDGDIAYTVEFLAVPEEAAVGETFTVRWRVDGPSATIAHTGSHYGTSSVPEPESPADYPRSAGVRENTRVPAEFSAEVTLDQPGTWYIRSHALDAGAHSWSPERRIEVHAGVAPPPEAGAIVVTLTEYPRNVEWGERFNVTWTLAGAPGTAPHSGVHWALTSVPDPQTPEDYGNTSGAQEPADVPGEYIAEVVFESDTPSENATFYMRAHALRDGRHYWSREATIAVAAADAGAEHDVEASDVGLRFVPPDVVIDAGDTVNWTNVGNLRHTVTFEDLEGGGTQELADLAPDEAVSYTFEEPGTYRYRCRYHSSGYTTGMVGTVTVE